MLKNWGSVKKTCGQGQNSPLLLNWRMNFAYYFFYFFPSLFNKVNIRNCNRDILLTYNTLKIPSTAFKSSIEALKT